MPLKECEEYLQYKGIEIPRHQIVEYYMYLGGIPYYYSLLDKRLSTTQNINELFYKENGFLNNSQLLTQTKSGLTRSEIEKELDEITGASIDRTLQELIECDFIRKYINYSKKQKVQYIK